jgi:hypothetical protein
VRETSVGGGGRVEAEETSWVEHGGGSRLVEGRERWESTTAREETEAPCLLVRCCAGEPLAMNQHP